MREMETKICSQFDTSTLLILSSYCLRTCRSMRHAVAHYALAATIDSLWVTNASPIKDERHANSPYIQYCSCVHCHNAFHFPFVIFSDAGMFGPF